MTDHEMKLAAARKRVAQLDEAQGHEDRSLGTLIEALAAGLNGVDDGPAYDALVMLMDIRSVVSNTPDITAASLKTLFLALDEGHKVSLKRVPLIDPNRN